MCGTNFAIAGQRPELVRCVVVMWFVAKDDAHRHRRIGGNLIAVCESLDKMCEE
jgi:hypothetical protein